MISPSISAPALAFYRRRQRDVNKFIELSILLAVVALEVVLVGTATWLAYGYLDHLIEDSFYRVPLVQTGPLLTRLVELGLPAFGIFALVNLLALALIAGLWRYHENLILRDLIKVIEKTHQLDFSADPPACRQHQALWLAAAWKTRERSRFAAIRNQVGLLDAALTADDFPHDLRIALRRFDQLLA